MPMELMLALAQGKLPTVIDRPEDIDKLRVLAAADLVETHLPDVGDAVQRACVLSITSVGRAALRKAFPQHALAPSAKPGAAVPDPGHGGRGP